MHLAAKWSLSSPKPSTICSNQSKMISYINLWDLIYLMIRDVRVSIFASSVEKCFSAGADLKERAEMSVEEAEAFVDRLRSTFDLISVHTRERYKTISHRIG